MKAEIVTFTQEGFTAARGIKFENGLILRSPNVLWLGKDGREEAERQFDEVVEALRNHQVMYPDGCDATKPCEKEQ